MDAHGARFGFVRAVVALAGLSSQQRLQAVGVLGRPVRSVALLSDQVDSTSELVLWNPELGSGAVWQEHGRWRATPGADSILRLLDEQLP